MIKYETIISNFDDKTTLYNWLRKVEEALKHASATNFVVNKKGNATLSFSITFADGTTLESGDIVLQQGESVDQARIASGILQLHLTNGTWLTAGNIKPVSNFEINASQHLIVNYQDGTSQDLGAIFNGNVNISGTLNATKVTGDEIIENMIGYSFYPELNPSDIVLTPIYAGVVKTGNKLTFVVFSKVKKTGGADNRMAFHFDIPSAVGNQLVPFAIGGITDLLDDKKIDLLEDGTLDTFASMNVVIQKLSNTRVSMTLRGFSALTLNTDYLVRIEVTFLLSDNLAQ